MVDIKRNKNIFILFFVIIAINFSIIKAGVIIPEKNFPLMMNKPTVSQRGFDLILNFKLPEDSIGLRYNEYIGVAFIINQGVYDMFADTYDFSNNKFNDRFKCSLKENMTYINIKVSAVPSARGANLLPESNILYCRLDDLVNELKAGKSYKLTITLDLISFTNQFIRNVGIFTSTSNSAEKIIIDSLPVFGSLGFYKNLATTTGILQITGLNINSPRFTSADSKLYPYDSFDVEIFLKATDYIDPKNSIFIITYPKNTVSPPMSIVSEEFKQKIINFPKLEGNLELSNFSEESLEIKNIGEVLYANREFKLVLKSWKGLDTNIGNSQNFEIWVFYRNTYSVQSYSIYKNAFLINKGSFKFVEIDHPEEIEIYSTAAWPLKFTFQTNYDLINGGYVVIQQTNTIENKVKWIFSASTCDFTENDPNIVNLILGQRPVCAPTQNSLVFENFSYIDFFTGSGIFFKLPKILSTSKYFVTVWGIADKCGTSNDPSNMDYSTQKFAFKFTVYKTYDPSKEGMKRFTEASNNTILAQSEEIKMKNLCRSATTEINYSEAKANKDNTGDRLFYKEINSFDLLSTNPYTYTCTDGSCFSSDIRGSSTAIYLNSESLQEHYFMLKATFPLTEDSRLRDVFPFSITNEYNAQPGYIKLKISKMFTGQGDSRSGGNMCILSWNFLLDNENKSGDYKLTRDIFETSSNANFITSSNTMNKSKLILPEDKSTSMIQITSNFDAGNTNFNLIRENVIQCTDDNVLTNKTCIGNFFLYSNCIKIKKPVKPIKTIYTYFDVLYIFEFAKDSSSNPVSSRVVRFVKLFPEYGVFNNPDGQTVRNSLLSYHYAYGNSEADNPVCILEISGNRMAEFINDNQSSSLNTLAIFLFNVNLLDIDYSKTANTYPIMTKENDTLSAFANNNSITFSTDNPNSNKLQYDQSYSTLIYPDITSNYLYMASTLIIKNPNNFLIENSSNSSDVYIPTMCPYLRDNSSHITNPVVTIQLMSIQEDNTVESNFAIYKYSSNLMHQISQSKNVSFSTSENLATLRFNRYSSISSEDELNVLNGTIKNPSLTVNCSGFSVFFNSDITVTDLQLVLSNTQYVPYFSNLAYDIFVHGKRFRKIGILALSNALTINSSGDINSIETGDLKFTGVSRPAVSEFFNDQTKKFITKDLIGFYCVSKFVQHNNYLTNYVNDISRTSKVSNFILDFNPDESNISKITYSNDNKATFYKNYVGGNFGAEIDLNSSAPVGSYFNLVNKQNFNPNTTCGIMNTINNKAITCSSNNLYVINCPITESLSNYKICCYNVALNSDVSFDNFSIIFPTEDIDNLTSYFSTEIYSASSIYLDWLVNYASLPDVATMESASIKSIEYSYVANADAIGKATIEITLPQELPRNAKISISGNFYKLAIPDVIPFCSVSTSKVFSPDYEKGDSIFNSCTASNILSTTNSLIIVTKKDIYKCGLSFSKTIYLKLWPVITYNFTATNDKKYIINVVANSSGEQLAKNKITQELPDIEFKITNEIKNPLLSGLWDNLSRIIRILPRLAEESAFYDFEFDINSNRYIFGEILPNEFSLFFPINLFGTSLSNLECIYLNNIYGKINCYDEGDGIYTIRFSQPVSLEEDNPIIRISGIVNPAIDARFLRITCTFNYVNPNGERFNLLTGGALLIGGITNPTSVRNIGNLILSADKYVLSDTNPRSLGMITLKVAFDRSMTLPPSSIVNPIIIITFPSEFNFAFFNQVSITASITEYIFTETNNGFQEGLVFNISSMSFFKNSIVLNFDFTKSMDRFGYWMIVLSNIPSPFDTTTTSAIKVCLTNRSFGILFKTYTNLNTLETGILTNKIDNFLTSHKGLSYSYDGLKYIVDVVSITDEDEKNVIYITPGVYVEYKFVIRPNSNFLPTSNTEIYLRDDSFKLGQPSYLLLSSVGHVSFLIGTTCTTFKGTFYITFNNSETKYYAMIPPIKVVVKEKQVFTINISYDNSVPKESFSLIYYKLNSLNYDELSLTWKSDPLNDSSASIYSIVIPPRTKESSTTFQIFNPDQEKSQKFTIQDPSSCFKMQENSITINLGKATFPNLFELDDFELKSKFTYNENSQSSIKNSVILDFEPPISPINIFCAIECIESDFPSNIDIMNSKEDSGYIFKSYVAKKEPIKIQFFNLLRGQEYKVKCLLETTQSRSTKRQKTEVYINQSMTDAQAQLKTPPVPHTRCLKYAFRGDPGSIIKNKLMNYCQTQFMGSCVKCVDNYGTLLPGLSMDFFYGCILQKDKPSIFNQEITLANPFGEFDYPMGKELYTICAVPDLRCENEIQTKNYENNFLSMMRSLETEESFSETLKIPFPFAPLYSIYDYNDDWIPLATNIMVGPPESNVNGYFSIEISNIEPLACFWLISPSAISDYTFKEIMMCDDISRCGFIRVNNSIKRIMSDNHNLKIFLAGQYSVWLACFNDIPNPIIESTPKKITEFGIKAIDYMPLSGNATSLNNRSMIWVFILLVWLLFR